MMLDSFFPFFTFILIDELLTLRVNKWDKGFWNSLIDSISRFLEILLLDFQTSNLDFFLG